MHIDLRPRLREISRQIQHAEALVPERNQLIRWAVKRDGYSEREIAGDTGLSQPRVHEIANE